MTERDWNLPASLDAAMRQQYSTVKPAPAFANRLESELRQRHTELLKSATTSQAHKPRRNIMRSLRAQPVLAIIILILAILILTGVAYAVGRMTGFIPGFGFTSSSQTIYLLKEPVKAVNEDVNITVTQVVSGDEEFWVQFSATGIEEEPFYFNHADVSLTNGGKFSHSRGSGAGSGSDPSGYKYQWMFAFPPLPPGTNQVTLSLEDLQGRRFDFILELRPAQAGEFIPVVENPSASQQSEINNDISLAIDHVTADADKTIFQVSVELADPNLHLASDWGVTLKDQRGAIYPVVEATSEIQISEGNSKVFQTGPFSGDESLILSLTPYSNSSSIQVFRDYSMNEWEAFTFDPGKNPEVGQEWLMDESFQVEEFTIQLVKARLTSPDQLEFEFAPSDPVSGISLFTPDSLLRGAGGANAQGIEGFTSYLSFSEVPSHPFDIYIRRIYYMVPGTWEIEWTPPASPEDPIFAPTPTSTDQPPEIAPTEMITNPIILEVQHLADRFDSQFQQGPAWIHEVSEKISREEPGQSLLPPYVVTDEWYEIDAGGHITRMVHIDRDNSGNVVQMSAVVGNYSVNFTFGSANTYDRSDWKYSADKVNWILDDSVEEGSQITREEITCENGQPCLLITTLNVYDPPLVDTMEDLTYTGGGRRIWIDRTTGQQIQMQAYGILEGDKELIENTTSYLIFEKLDSPPQEILDILDNVQVP